MPLLPNELFSLGGGVAMFALQFALEFSKNVFVTSSSKEKIDKALIAPKKRKPTKVPKGVIEKRLEGKKNKSSIKENRKKVKL